MLHAPSGEQRNELGLELVREVCDVLASVLADDEHLAEMGLGRCVALEAVLITALLLADLAVPAETLESLGLHLVCEVLWRSDCELNQDRNHRNNIDYIPSARGILDRQYE